ncbi:biotin carboxylase N-terminal domain-containing protein [Actinomycetospora lutea]|uniref:acetyl/propionyl/methylcrotonyl-CoA carboxylase subunit alpha n=1 Tax=Actinomycetospora lutea TaxID=663604 RepID=UPI002366B911|nr:biotin carboxylase N-terminal domain-containing protein [Actinomycetospora lutea]MDD7938053.1 biotin carboxylase N-terminal domain-containing protein [Actinomycetospora lutea]
MFQSVLIANRGEIAVRITRTLHARGLRAVAVYTDPDAGAPHVAAADVAVRVPDYLDGAAILEAGRAVGAQAVHPGYGFLAENAGFARQVADAGLTWIGPPPEAIEAMGDKIRAKATVGPAGVPLVPGSDGSGLSDAEVAAAARGIGFPVLLKPSAGGGGKGMHVVERDGDLEDAIAAARREARGSFGDDTLLVERYVTDPRHVEIQVLADAHGTVVHLGERECSLQRRHQKVVEEAPSAVLDATQRHAMGQAAVEAARACGYVGAGTVEFVTNADASEFFFLEMNTRLQVEHPVTEEVVRVRSGRLDLVAEQLRIAAGEELGYDQGDVTLEGHAVEVRLYAEDPARGFLPTGGRVLDLVWPGGDAAQRSSTIDGGARVDAGVAAGTEVGSRYDPMLAKIITWGRDRASAFDRLDAALAATTVLGVRTNLAWLRTLIADEDVRAGRLDTGLIARLPVPAEDLPDDVLAAAALAGLLDLAEKAAGDDPFDRIGGWRLGADPAPARWRVVPAAGATGDPVDVAVAGPPHAAVVTIGAEGTPRPAQGRREGADVVLTLDGATRRFRTATTGGADGVRWLGREGGVWALREQERLRAARTAAGGQDGPLTAPMPGTVTAVEVAEGDHVTAGQRLVVVEAMKMEHVVSAPVDGVVKDLAATAGAAVALDAPLVTVVPDPGE